MKITLSKQTPENAKVDVLVVPARNAKLEGTLGELDKALDGILKTTFEDEDFAGKKGQTIRIPTGGKLSAKWLVVVGVGDESDVKAARLIGHHGIKVGKQRPTFAIVPTEATQASVRALVEAAVLAGYQYDTYFTGEKKKNAKKRTIKSVALIVPNPRSAPLKRAVEDGQSVAYGVSIARDLVNAPPNDLNPLSFADIAKTEGEKLGLKVNIWNKKKIQTAKMDLFIAVNAGSAIEPRLIHLVYKPKTKAKAKVAFVGKGLTFDAGGLCIKPGGPMYGMKCDMAGGATTLGVVLAAARLELPIEVHALIGCTENMLGAEAYRPGDVFTSHDGKTVEIINTDAEGRLVLADVLSYTDKTIKPDIIIDHATLTGACMVALGPRRAALYTDDEELQQSYAHAAELAEERYWHMPLDKDLRKMLDSDIADLKHTGARWGGSITAALFLREFVSSSRWMHLDIAGPAFLDGPHEREPKGATGFGVSTGVRFLEYLSLDE